MHKSAVKHLEESQLLQHPVEHGLLALRRFHLVDGARDLQEIVELGKCLTMKSIHINVRNLLQDHLLEAKLESPLRRLCFNQTAPDAHVR